MRKIKFNEMEFPLTLETNSFLSQWCCKCGARHIWYFDVMRQKKPENDLVFIDMFRDWKGEELRRYYEKSKKSGK